MKNRLVLCMLCLAMFSQTALTQDNLVEQEVRFAKIEVTLSQLNEAVRNLNGQLATIQLTILGLFAAFFIPLVVFIMQIKTQLITLKHDVATLKHDVANLKDKVNGLEGQIEQSEQRTEARLKENRAELMKHTTEQSITIHKQLNQIREALAVQLGIVLEPEDQT